MSNTVNSEDDVDSPGQESVRANFNSMFAGGRSFSGHERNCCYLNTNGSSAAEGRFANVSAASGIDFPDDGRALALVDWDQDGDLDVWTSNRNAPRLRFLRNNAETSGRFLSLRLQGNGTVTNRDAIGARVVLQVKRDQDTTAEDAFLPLIKTLRAGEGFLSQSSKTLHFGLGTSQHIEHATVQWPGGDREVFRNLQPGNRYLLIQGTGEAKLSPSLPREIKLRPQPQQPIETSGSINRLATPIEFPPLPFQAWNGDNHLVQPSKGKALLLNFWASWCVPCLKELKELGDAEETIRDSNLDILALSVDGMKNDPLTAETAAQFLNSTGFHFRSGRATANLINGLKSLNVLKTEQSGLPLPFSVLLDHRGRLLAIYRGPIHVEDVLADVAFSGTNILDRFQRAAPFDGEVIRHPVAVKALQRFEADARFEYARRLQQAGKLKMAVSQYQQVLKVWPQSDNAHSAIGTLQIHLGQFKLAKAHLEKALQLNPRSVAAHINLGGMYASQQQYDLALTHYQQASELDPKDAQVYFNRARIHEAREEFDTAIDAYSQAIAVQPEFTEAFFNRGSLHIKQHQFEAAVEDFTRVIHQKPNYALAYKKRGAAHLQLGAFEAGLTDFSTALKALPDDAELYTNRGMAYQGLGQFAFAISDFTKAVDMNVEAPQTYNNLAWLLATCPNAELRDGERALKYAKRACELSQWSYFGALDTLAAAYAEVGRFEDARKWQKRSIQYAPKQQRPDLQARLALYEDNQPYRESNAR